MTRRDRAPRARRRGRLRRAGGSASRTCGSRSSTCRRPATSRWRRRTAATCSSTTASSTTSASSRASSSARGHALPLATRHRGRAPRLRGVGPGLPRALRRHVRVRDLGRRASASSSLARDRFGVKPLYYAQHRRAPRCSPPRSRRCSRPGSRPRVVPEALRRVLHVPERLLRPDALRRRADAPGRAHARASTSRGARVERYWDLEFEPDESRVARTSGSSSVRGAFETAVTRQLVSDVPVGSYLSGGMDSASIAAVACARRSRG